jgi:hypothetical protein
MPIAEAVAGSATASARLRRSISSVDAGRLQHQSCGGRRCLAGSLARVLGIAGCAGGRGDIEPGRALGRNGFARFHSRPCRSVARQADIAEVARGSAVKRSRASSVRRVERIRSAVRRDRAHVPTGEVSVIAGTGRVHIPDLRPNSVSYAAASASVPGRPRRGLITGRHRWCLLPPVTLRLSSVHRSITGHGARIYMPWALCRTEAAGRAVGGGGW